MRSQSTRSFAKGDTLQKEGSCLFDQRTTDSYAEVHDQQPDYLHRVCADRRVRECDATRGLRHHNLKWQAKVGRHHHIWAIFLCVTWYKSKRGRANVHGELHFSVNDPPAPAFQVLSVQQEGFDTPIPQEKCQEAHGFRRRKFTPRTRPGTCKQTRSETRYCANLA